MRSRRLFRAAASRADQSRGPSSTPDSCVSDAPSCPTVCVGPRFRSRSVYELYMQKHGALNIFIIIVVIIIVIVTIAITTLINIIASWGSDADDEDDDPRGGAMMRRRGRRSRWMRWWRTRDHHQQRGGRPQPRATFTTASSSLAPVRAKGLSTHHHLPSLSLLPLLRRASPCHFSL